MLNVWKIVKEGVNIDGQFLCFDIGGTFIKYSLFDQSGKQLQATVKVATAIQIEGNQILEQILLITEQLSMVNTLKGIAVSTAGVVDSQTGAISYSGYTIPGYTGTQLKARLEEKFQLPCAVINDVNAACYGEFWKGFPTSGKPQSLCCLTIGTGIGGGLIINDTLYTGFSDMAAEVGYLPLKKGLFQDLASTTALLKAAQEVEGIELTGEAFFEKLATEPNSAYHDVLENFIESLAEGLLMIIYILNPETIVLGGGIMAQAALLLPKLETALEKQVIDHRFLSSQIKAASLGNNAGMLGALYYLLQTLGE